MTTIEPDDLARLEARLKAVASLPYETLLAMGCTKGPRHRWSRKGGRRPTCKNCGLTDFSEPVFDQAEHRAAVRHAILTGQTLG